MDFTIREAVLDDRERIMPLQKEIADLHHVGAPQLFKDEARYYSPEAFREKLENPLGVTYIAENDKGEVVGYLFAWLMQYRNHPTYVDFDKFYIDDICVASSSRRQGIGKALMEKALLKAKEMNALELELGVWGFNEDAIEFYKACGFEIQACRMAKTIKE